MVRKHRIQYNGDKDFRLYRTKEELIKNIKESINNKCPHCNNDKYEIIGKSPICYDDKYDKWSTKYLCDCGKHFYSNKKEDNNLPF